MIAEQLQINGSITTSPRPSVPVSAASYLAQPISETAKLKAKAADVLNLATDAETPLPFGGVVNANFVYICAVGGKVKAKITSADGAEQTVPIDPLHMTISSSTPITAISLTREAGQDTSVNYILGEFAAG